MKPDNDLRHVGLFLSAGKRSRSTLRLEDQLRQPLFGNRALPPIVNVESWGRTRPVSIRSMQKRMDVPGAVLRCELPQVIIQVDLQKLAPLGGRHLAE